MDVFLNDLDQVLQSALGQGISKIIVPGVDVESSHKAVDLAHHYPNIYAAVGIHPEAVDTSSTNSIDEILTLSQEPKVVAIGEIGLDYYFTQENRQEQINLFVSMLKIASRVKKPVLVHSRNSMEEVLKILENWKNIEITNENESLGILHAFEGNMIQAEWAIKNGFLLGVGGPVTYKNSRTKHEIFSQISLDSLVLETDSPYLPPHPFRGTRNEPSRLTMIAESLASLRETHIDKIIVSTTNNANRLFHWDE